MESWILYDLSRVETRLPASQRDLGKSIRRWRDAHSASSDLTLAANMIEHAHRVCLEGEEANSITLIGLVHAAVMAYSRALERRSKHRGQLSITGNLNSEQTRFHQRLVHLRDEAIAHHGPAGTRQSWHADSALILNDGVTWQPVVLAKVPVFDKEFAMQFSKHLEVVLNFISQEIIKRQERFETMLRARLRDKDVLAVLLSAQLSEQEAAQYRAALSVGSRSGRIIAILDDL